MLKIPTTVSLLQAARQTSKSRSDSEVSAPECSGKEVEEAAVEGASIQARSKQNVRQQVGGGARAALPAAGVRTCCQSVSGVRQTSVPSTVDMNRGFTESIYRLLQ